MVPALGNWLTEDRALAGTYPRSYGVTFPSRSTSSGGSSGGSSYRGGSSSYSGGK